MLRHRRLTYANVVSTLALFLALTGGAVYAASRIDTKNIAKNAVTTGKIAPRAVTAKRLDADSVRAKQLARAAVGGTAIADGSVSPDKLEVPVFFVADPTGGSAEVDGSFGPYPVDGGTWTQNPGQINVIFGEATATLAYDGSGSGACEVYFDIRLNGVQVGGGQLRTDSTTAQELTASLGAQPEIGPEQPEQNEMTINLGSNGDCTPDSTVDSSRFQVLDFG
ncbi:MAG: hypothetical protein R2718_03125 [Solirubrobacterales bacterium]|nr:hypothetical protein [Solirubrobacterales bacterium]